MIRIANETSYLISNNKHVSDETRETNGITRRIVSHLLVFLVGLSVAFFYGDGDPSQQAFQTRNLPIEKETKYTSSSRLRTVDKHRTDAVDDGHRARYSKFQGLGFQIYTGGAPAYTDQKNKVKNPECQGMGSYGHLEGELQCYIGHEDSFLDVEQRLGVMVDAVERAYEVADPSGDILKLFVAPEFFFRGINGAYNISKEYDELTKEECNEVCQILTGLEELVAQERFRDWLFVFGTVIASETLPVEDEFDYMFFNFAPVYRGYDPERGSFAGKRFLAPKRYISRIDFLTPRRHFNESLTKELLDEPSPPSTKTVVNPYDFRNDRYDNQRWEEYKGSLEAREYAFVNYGWFLLDNITFSLEVCLDHDRHSALDSFMANLVTGSKQLVPHGRPDGLDYVRIPNHQAQISIVSSAGMTVNPESLVLANNGSIFLQDGLENKTSFSYFEDECQKGLQFGGGSELVQRYAVLTPTDVYFDYHLVSARTGYPVYNPNDIHWADALNGIFSAAMYPPQIMVYDPITIPEM